LVITEPIVEGRHKMDAIHTFPISLSAQNNVEGRHKMDGNRIK